MSKLLTSGIHAGMPPSLLWRISALMLMGAKASSVVLIPKKRVVVAVQSNVNHDICYQAAHSLG